MPTNELLDFWKLDQQDYDNCNLIKWWLNHKPTYWNLYDLAMDVLSIPGEFSFSFDFIQLTSVTLSFLASAVAVERVLSGGCNTISICCASLKSDTIQTLMLVKKKLHQQHVSS